MLKRMRLLEKKKSDEGSAVIEFVLMAIPLFIPALLFFLSMQRIAINELQMENLARQSLRAFVTANSLSDGHQRVQFVLDKFSEMDSGNGVNRAKFTYNISCGGQKCLTPGSTVKIDLYRTLETYADDKNPRKVVASASGTVDKWRQ